ncbi:MULTISPECIES: helix-turn-helix domain-containing protein [Arcobacteraceae]|uniref:helix-turn-helix domain-containing protein n=1 Tax=Arcobacteraceae TaxID=2808963 RepID=UPI00100A8CB3|nr:helix-turn-helix domain-containing protein [Arcobacter sp. CECT 8989]RXK03803.1 hypothetical protein CRV02_01000 [Arcobacter sp. CECT 8989]
MASKQDEILSHLQMGFTITPAVAAQDYNCFCLAAVISKIEKKGHIVYRRVIDGTKSKEYSFTPFSE